MGKRHGIVVVKKNGTANMLIHDLASEDQAVAIRKRYGIVVVKKDGTAHMLIHDLASEDQAVAIGKRLTALGLDGLRPADDPADPPVEVWEYDERGDGYGIGWVDLRYAPVGEFEFINKNRRSGEEYGEWLDQSLRFGPD
jgi:hypothetical protein